MRIWVQIKLLVLLTQACLLLRVSVCLQPHTHVRLFCVCGCESVRVCEREKKTWQMEWSAQGTLVDNSVSVLCSTEHQSLPLSDKTQRNGKRRVCAFSNPCRSCVTVKRLLFQKSCIKYLCSFADPAALEFVSHLGVVWPLKRKLPQNQLGWASPGPRCFGLLSTSRIRS